MDDIKNIGATPAQHSFCLKKFMKGMRYHSALSSVDCDTFYASFFIQSLNLSTTSLS